MSNVVEFVLKLKDLLSGGMQTAASISQQASSVMQVAATNTTVAINNQARALENLTNEYKVLQALPKGSEIKMAQAPLTKYGRDFMTVRDSIQGSIQGIHDKVSTTMKSASTKVGGFASSMWNMTKNAASSTGTMVKHLFTHREALKSVGGAVGSLIGITSIFDGVQQATGISTDLLSLAQEGLNLVMRANPIGFVIGAVIALIVWIKTLTDHNKYWASSLKSLWGVIKDFAALNLIAWKGIGQSISYWIQYAWLEIKGFVEYAVEALSRVGESIQLAKSGDWSGAKAVFQTEIKPASFAEQEKLTAQHLLDVNENAKQSADLTIGIVKGMASVIDNAKTGWINRNKPGTDPTKDAKTITDTVPKPRTHNNPTRSPRMESDKSNAITGGGTRNVTINIAQLGNNMTIQTTNLKESAEEIGKVIRTEIIKIVSSGSSAAFGN